MTYNVSSGTLNPAQSWSAWCSAIGMKPPEAHPTDGDVAQDGDGRITTDNRHVLHAADTDDRRQQRQSCDVDRRGGVSWTGRSQCSCPFL